MFPCSVDQMHTKKLRAGFGSGLLKMEESRTLFAGLFSIYSQITLVVDALDQCDQDQLPGFDLMNILDKFFYLSPKPV